MAWYAKFDGIDGECQHKDHKTWCNAAEFTMSAHKSGGGGTGRARIGGKMHLDDMNLRLDTDKALPKLLDAAGKGNVFSKVTVHGTATYGGAGEQVYLEIALTNVMISNYSFGGRGDDVASNDLQVHLNFEEIKTTYTAYGKDGKSQGKVEASWKVEEGEA